MHTRISDFHCNRNNQNIAKVLFLETLISSRYNDAEQYYERSKSMLMSTPKCIILEILDTLR